MERLFSPSTHIHDILQRRGRPRPPESLQELNLDASTERFWGDERGFTYAELYAILGNGETVAWLTPHAAIGRIDGSAAMLFEIRSLLLSLHFHPDGEGIDLG